MSPTQGQRGRKPQACWLPGRAPGRGPALCLWATLPQGRHPPHQGPPRAWCFLSTLAGGQDTCAWDHLPQHCKKRLPGDGHVGVGASWPLGPLGRNQPRAWLVPLQASAQPSAACSPPLTPTPPWSSAPTAPCSPICSGSRAPGRPPLARGDPAPTHRGPGVQRPMAFSPMASGGSQGRGVEGAPEPCPLPVGSGRRGQERQRGQHPWGGTAVAPGLVGASCPMTSPRSPVWSESRGPGP